MKRFLPNALTLLRLVLTPLIIGLLLQDPPLFLPAAICFLVASLSDFGDGFLARLWKQESALGAWLDPFADKLLLTSLFLLFAWKALLPPLVWGVVVGRDLLILAGTFLLRKAGKILTIQPLWISKLNTVFQMSLICGALGMGAWGLKIEEISASVFFHWLTGLTVLTTVLSGIAYGYKGWVLCNRQPNN